MEKEHKPIPQIILKEWDYSKNEIDPLTISIGSHKKVWWVCDKKHNWEAAVYSRTLAKNGCPYCAGKKTTLEKSFGYQNKKLLAEWHPDNIFNPYSVSIKSNKKIKWVCSHNQNHVWSTTIYHRVHNKRGCPYCSGRKVLPEESLAEKRKDIMKYWHHNNAIDPWKISPVSGKLVKWICDANPGHIWKARVADVSRGTRCPYCSNRKVLLNDSFGFNCQILLREWDYDKNTIDPLSITSGSAKKVWWICSNNNSHVWEAAIRERTRNGTGCPRCACGKSKASQRWLDELLVFDREKIVYVNKCKYIVDGYDQDTNTIFEYFGSFWHGNPNIYNPNHINPVNKKSFSFLFEETKCKIRNLLKGGYDVCLTWGE